MGALSPRHYADAILRREGTIDMVPRRLRDQVQGHLDDAAERAKTSDETRIKHYVGWIADMKSRDDRRVALAKAPKHLQERIRAGVVERFRERAREAVA